MAQTTGNSPKCCPHCSADLVVTRGDGRCWHCRSPLSPELTAQLGPPLKAPEFPNFPRRDRRLARYLKLLLAVLFMGVMSLSKGFTVFFALPLLIFVVMPAVASSQITTDQRLAEGTAHPSMPLLANIQLACACVFYFVIPLAGDGSPVIFYIVSGPVAEMLFPILTVAAVFGFLIASVKFSQASRAVAPPTQ